MLIDNPQALAATLSAMIVTVGSTKGGVGKTTLATQLALARQLAGHAVLLIDADRQGSAQNAATMRVERRRRLASTLPTAGCCGRRSPRWPRSMLSSAASSPPDEQRR